MSFRKGNITRIYMKDFLTFDEIEVRPQPYLNIVIGPNGNGKSTILCGICLGLGGKPSITGRGKDAVEYIKYDKQIAVIEIEIYVGGNSQNIVIRRTFNRQNHNTWKLQGEEVRPKDIEAKVREVGIQIDNLCQFLPQDRVADFAKLNKVQLLENTEKAIGEEDLYRHHEILKQSGKEFQEIKDALDSLQHQHDLEVNKNERIKDQVDSHKIKQNIEQNIKDLERRRYFWMYADLRKQWIKLKEEKNALRKEQEELSQQWRPLEEKIKNAKMEIDKLKEKNSSLEKQCSVYQRELDKIDNKYDDCIEAIDTEKQNYDILKNQELKRCNEIQDMQQQIQIYEEKMSSIQELDPKEIEERMMQLSEDIKTLTQTYQMSEHEIQNIKYEIQTGEAQLKELRNEEHKLQNISQMRINQLSVKNKPAFQALNWLKKNRDRFRAPIHDPICTQISLKDQKFARYVEDRIAFRDHNLFVCEDKDDINDFKREMDKLGIQVNIAYSSPEDCSIYKPAITLEQIRRAGFRDFQCYLKDVIDAPDAIMSFLCKNYGIHRIPVALSGTYSDRIPEQLTFFYIGESKYSKTQSRYDKEWSTSIHPVEQVDLLSDTVDKKRLDVVKQDIQNFDETITAHKSKVQELFMKQKEVQIQREKCREEKKNLNSGITERKRLVLIINQKLKNIETREAEAVDLPAEKIKMKERIQNHLKKLITLLQQKDKYFVEIVKLQESKTLLVVTGSTLNTNKSKWNDELLNGQERLHEIKTQYTDKARQVERKSVEAQHCISKLTKMLNIARIEDLSNEDKENFTKTGPQGLEQVEIKLAELQAKKECLIAADDEVVKEYHRREREIAVMAKNIELAAKNVATKNASLEESRSEWLPKIQQLTDDISSHFMRMMSQLGCAGEVLLDYGENKDDFTNYGLVIRVKFRDNESLRELNAQHQSGGERSVSTALYLLALQKLRPVPFRCIDEINQGMDPENERRMFNMLMESVSDGNASQCFLVTPKLLPNLTQNSHTNVMIVYNSQNIPPHRAMRLKKHCRYQKKLKHLI